MKKILFTLLFTPLAYLATAQQTIPLYEKEVPNSIPATNEEHWEWGKDSILRISKVSVPSITVYLAALAKANGTSVIICPGGGYSILAASHEGTDVAKRLNEMGVTAFVLKYRIPSDVYMKDKETGPLQDAQRAIQMVRQNAVQWNVNPNRVGIMGFSAGGHLASTAGTHFSKAYIENKDNINLRPDFMVLLYPVISFTDSLAHIGSRTNLIGKDPTAEKINEYSNESQITPQTPPVFLVHAGDDRTVKVQNSLAFFEALQKNKVPAEMHIYPKGGHGFGMNNKTTKDNWTDRLENWLESNGWLSK